MFERDEDGDCVDVRDDLNKPFKERIEIVRDELPDVRAEEYYVPDPCADSEPPRLLHIRKYWICGPMDRGGFYGFGLNVPQTSCYALAAQDNCGEPMQNASFINMHENERAMGSCEQPESCMQLRTELRGCEE